MYETVPASPYDAALINALCEGDVSAWCFLPADITEPACCSRPFRVLWNLPSATFGTCGKFPQSSLARVFDTTGVSAEEFFSRVSAHCTEIPDRLQLLQKDGARIQASIHCVFNSISGAVVGKLLQFRALTETDAIASLLDQIYAARKKLEVLSKREMEILNLVYEGRTNKAISIATEISEKTVEKHRSRIMLKLGLSCTTLMIRIITMARMLPTPMKPPENNSTGGQLEELHT